MAQHRAILLSSAAGVLAAALFATPSLAAEATIAPGALPALGKVDERFQSYNVETVEVVGGNFWAPYPAPGDKPAQTDGQKSGGVDIAGAMFRKRAPLDLKGDRRLRVLAKALGP